MAAFATNFTCLAPGKQNKHMVWVERGQDLDIDCFVSTLSGFYNNCKYSCVSVDNNLWGGASCVICWFILHVVEQEGSREKDVCNRKAVAEGPGGDRYSSAAALLFHFYKQRAGTGGSHPHVQHSSVQRSTLVCRCF